MIKRRKMVTRHLVILMVVVLSSVVAEISVPTKVEVNPKPLSETSAVIVTWDPPTELGGNSEEDLKYLIKYCEINNETTCLNTTLSTSRRVELAKLEKESIYNYHIYPVGKDNEQGTEHSSIFKTDSKRTCLPNQYTCVGSDQCIDPRKKCDGILNCADSSDEDSNSGCSLPADTPSGIKVENIDDTSATVIFTQNPQPDRATGYEIELVDTVSQNITTIQVSHQSLSPAPRSTNITSLVASTSYKLRVRAVNRAGKGPWSDDITFTTSLGPPGDIEGAKVTPVPLLEATAATIQWEVPKDLNGHDAASLQYEVKYCELNFPETCKTLPKTKDRSATVEELKKHSYYQYGITVYDSNNQTGRKPYESYFRTERKNSCSNGFFRCTLSDQCIFTNRTCNGIPDCGDSSDERLDAGCKPPLNAPQNLKVVKKTSNSLDLSWDPVPLSDRPRAYIIEVAGENEQTQSVPTGFAARLIETTINNLLPNREYTIQIRAVNIVANGKNSEPFKATTDKLPGGDVLELPQSAVVIPVPYKESTSTAITWSAPKDLKGNDPDLIRYRVVYCSINMKCDKATPKSKVTNVTLTNLIPSHIYQFTIEVYSANNEMGPNSNYTHIFSTPKTNTCQEGYFACTRIAQCVKKDRTCNGLVDCRDATDEQSTAGCSAPKASVTPIIAKATETSITVEIEVVRDLSQRIHQYEVQNFETNELRTVRHSGFSARRKISIEFEGLTPGTKYTFRARAVNPSGAGSWSEMIEQVTRGEKPTGLTTTDKPSITEGSQPSPTKITTASKTIDPSGNSNSAGDAKSDDLTTAQKAGIAIGIILAVVIIIIAVIIMLRVRNGNRKDSVQGVSNSAYELEKHA